MGYKKEFLIAYSDLEQFCAKELEAIDSAAATAEEATGIDAADFWVILARADSEADGDTAFIADEIESLLDDDESGEGPSSDELGRKFAQLLSDLKAAFHNRTKGLGLLLLPLSPDADFGDFVRPPVVNEPLHAFVFVVQNMYALTPAGERLQHVVNEYQWYD